LNSSIDVVRIVARHTNGAGPPAADADSPPNLDLAAEQAGNPGNVLLHVIVEIKVDTVFIGIHN
jgi:hypothetical protein